MMQLQKDMWSQWLLDRRFGGDQEALQDALVNYLYPRRDRILQNANFKEGETLLDVGSGDGLIAFGALDNTEHGCVILSDISLDLLDHTRGIARVMDVIDRCRFVEAPAENLAPIQDGSVDVVTTRSVLIYVADKQKAFQEFFRVLKPGGRISLFEPINRLTASEPDHIFWGYDATPVSRLARRVQEVYEAIQPMDKDPMLNFDERDLLAYAENAGFREINMELQVESRNRSKKTNWETLIRTAPNPKVPSMEEAIQQVLTAAEIEEFTAHLRPLVERGEGMTRRAAAYLWATK